MHLSDTQVDQVYREGYVVLPRAVPIDLTKSARHAINHDIGTLGLNPRQLPTLREKGFCPDLCSAPVITDLANHSSIRPVAEQLLGHGAILPITKAWIMLRFPSPPGDERANPIGHFDGIGTGLNGTGKGVVNRNFTLMAVVYLNDVLEAFSGNFVVWPGSHWVVRDYFRSTGLQALTAGMPDLDLGREPVIVTGRAGDVVLCHHLLVHGPSQNLSANIRYGVIFRIRHREVATIGHDALTEMWLEWPGVRRNALVRPHIT